MEQPLFFFHLIIPFFTRETEIELADNKSRTSNAMVESSLTSKKYGIPSESFFEKSLTEVKEAPKLIAIKVRPVSSFITQNNIAITNHESLKKRKVNRAFK